MKASVISALTFSWINEIIWAGFKTTLNRKSLFQIDHSERSETVSVKLNNEWKKLALKYKNESTKLNTKPNKEIGHHFENECLNSSQLNKNSKLLDENSKVKKPSLAWCLCKAFYGKYLAGSFLRLIQEILAFAPPILLNKLINFFNDKQQNVTIGILYSVLVFSSLVAKSVLNQHCLYKMAVVGGRIRTSLMNLIYEKSLHLSSNSRRLTSVGEMSNLISVDSQTFVDFILYSSYIWSGPIQILICIFLLWQYLGVATLAGLAVMILSIPLNAYLSERERKLSVKKLKFQDSRIKMISELLNGIRVIKFYGWELSFQKIIEKIRNNEVAYLIKSAFLKCANNFTWDCSPIIVASTTFITFVLIDKNNKLDANITFVSLALLDIMRVPVLLLPIVISSLIKANVSLNRIRNFLLKEEIDVDFYDLKDNSGKLKLNVIIC